MLLLLLQTLKLRLVSCKLKAEMGRQTQLLFFLAGGSSPSGSRDFMGPAPGPFEWDHICNLQHEQSFNLDILIMLIIYDKHQHNINTLFS